MWNLEKWYWWTNVQGRNRDADIEDGLVATAGEGEGGMNWESSIDIYTLLYIKQMASGKLCSTGSSVVLYDDREGWVEVVGGGPKRAGMYVHL